MFTTDPRKAAEIQAAIQRSIGVRWDENDPAHARQAFADRKLLAAELGRVLMSLTELMVQVDGLRRAARAAGEQDA